MKTAALATGALALALAAAATAQTTTKSELIQKVLQAQQQDIESVARNLTERPAAQMMQEAGLAIQSSIPADKREAVGRAVEAEVKKYVDEALPIVRESALKLAPQTIAPILESRLSEDELRQLVTWLDSPVNKKYQSLAPEIRNTFVQQLIRDATPLVDPKLAALDARIRVVLGLPPAPGAAPAASAPPAGSSPSRPRPGASSPRASSPATR